MSDNNSPARRFYPFLAASALLTCFPAAFRVVIAEAQPVSRLVLSYAPLSGALVYPASPLTDSGVSPATTPGGTLTILPGAVVNSNTGSDRNIAVLNALGGTLTGTDNFNVSNSMTWTGGNLLSSSGTITTVDLSIGLVSAGVSMSGTQKLVSTGQANWTSNAGYVVTMAAGSSYTNQGTLTITTLANPSWDGGTFNNSGTLLKNSTDVDTISSTFLNSGSISAAAGTLFMSGGGTHTGTFATTAAGVLAFGGTHNFNSGSSILSGNFNFTSGASTFNAGSSYNAGAGTTTLSGAIVSFVPGSNLTSLGSTLTVTAGSLSLTSGSNPTLATFHADGGALLGSDNLTVTTAMTWGGGNILGGSGTLTTTDLAINLINASVAMADTRSLVSTGQAVWTSSSNFSLTMAAGNSYSNQGSLTINTFNGPFWNGGTINNVGTMAKTSPDVDTISALVNNSGSVSASAGTLLLGGGGTQTGTFATTGSGVIAFGGTHNFNSGAAIIGGNMSFVSGASNFNTGSSFDAGTGTTTLSGGIVNLPSVTTLISLGNTLVMTAGTLNLSSSTNPSVINFNANGGTFQGSDNLTVTTAMTWGGGNILGGSGTLTTTDLAINLINASVVMTDTRSLVSTGQATWTSSSNYNVTLLAGNTYSNQGTLTISTMNGPFWNNGTINNPGSMIKNSSDSNSITAVVNNSGSVTVNAGTLLLGGGGMQTGTFATTGSGIIAFGGNHNFNSGAAVIGGNMNFVSGASNFNTGSSYNAAGGTTTISGAIVTFIPGTTLASLGSTLEMTAGSLSLTSGADPSVINFNANGGTLQGSDNLTVTSAMTWGGGNILGGSGTLTTTDLAINLINASVAMADTRSLVSTGKATWTSSNNYSLTMAAGNSYSNQGSLTINTFNGPFWNGGTINNVGTMAKTSPDVNTISTLVNNSGSISASAGTLLLGGGGMQTGTFATTGSGIIAFGGNHNFNSGAAVIGGNMSFVSGASNFNTGSSFDAGTGTTTLSGGIVNLPSVTTLISLGNTLVMTAGTLNLSSGANPSVPTFTTGGGMLTGTDNLTIAQAAVLGGGTTLGGSGTITTRDLTISLFNGGVFMADTRNLISTGQALWTSNDNYSIGSATGNSYFNQGTLTINTIHGPFWSGGTINNPGVLIKNSSDSNLITAVLNNSGSVTVNAGTLRLSGGGTQTGSFASSGAGVLSFDGIHTFNAGASLTAVTLNFAGTSTFHPGSFLNVNASLFVASGTLALATGDSYVFDPLPDLAGTGTGTSVTYTAALDLATSRLIVEAADSADKSLKTAALNRAITQGAGPTNAWTGSGITSSAAAADPAHLALGLFDNAILSLATFGGTTSVDSNSILIAAAHLGDANRNGVVDIQDQSIITNNWQQSRDNWAAGDLNRDGFVDIQDLTIVTNNWQQTSSFALDTSVAQPSSGPLFTTPVPEPFSLALLSGPALLLFSRHPRRARR